LVTPRSSPCPGSAGQRVSPSAWHRGIPGGARTPACLSLPHPRLFVLAAAAQAPGADRPRSVISRGDLTPAGSMLTGLVPGSLFVYTECGNKCWSNR
jgi:hypothetical protein